MFGLSDYVVHCKNGHLCSLDGNLIHESKLYFTGVLIPVFDNMPTEDKITIFSESPINEWYVKIRYFNFIS